MAAIRGFPSSRRRADRLYAFRDGRLVAQGAPAAVLTPETMRAVFDVDPADLD